MAFVPAQEIDQTGIVRIVVVEGRIGQVIFSGEPEWLTDRVRRQVNRLREEAPLTIATMERMLLLANDAPGISIKTTLDRGVDAAGVIKLLVSVEHTSFDMQAGIGNRGSRALGPWTVDGSVSFYNSGGIDSSISARVLHTLGKNEMVYYGLDAALPIGIDGLELNVSLARVDAEPGLKILRLLEFATDSWSYSAGIRKPLIRSRSRNWQAWVNFDAKDSEGNMLGQTTSREKLRSIRIGSLYDWVGKTGASTSIEGQISHGISVFGGSKQGDPLVSASSDFNYTAAKINASRAQPLPRGLEIAMTLTAQYAFDPLVGSEQCGYGGGVFGSAFDSYEVSGDHCLMGGLELSRRFNSASKTMDFVQPYAFLCLSEKTDRFPFRWQMGDLSMVLWLKILLLQKRATL